MIPVSSGRLIRRRQRTGDGRGVRAPMPADVAARARLCRFHHDRGSAARAARRLVGAWRAIPRPKRDGCRRSRPGAGGRSPHCGMDLRAVCHPTFWRDGVVNLDTSAVAACATLDADPTWKSSIEAPVPLVLPVAVPGAGRVGAGAGTVVATAGRRPSAAGGGGGAPRYRVRRCRPWCDPVRAQQAAHLVADPCRPCDRSRRPAATGAAVAVSHPGRGLGARAHRADPARDLRRRRRPALLHPGPGDRLAAGVAGRCLDLAAGACAGGDADAGGHRAAGAGAARGSALRRLARLHPRLDRGAGDPGDRLVGASARADLRLLHRQRDVCAAVPARPRRRGARGAGPGQRVRVLADADAHRRRARRLLHHHLPAPATGDAPATAAAGPGAAAVRAVPARHRRGLLAVGRGGAEPARQSRADRRCGAAAAVLPAAGLARATLRLAVAGFVDAAVDAVRAALPGTDRVVAPGRGRAGAGAWHQPGVGDLLPAGDLRVGRADPGAASRPRPRQPHGDRGRTHRHPHPRRPAAASGRGAAGRRARRPAAGIGLHRHRPFQAHQRHPRPRRRRRLPALDRRLRAGAPAQHRHARPPGRRRDAAADARRHPGGRAARGRGHPPARRRAAAAARRPGAVMHAERRRGAMAARRERGGAVAAGRCRALRQQGRRPQPRQRVHPQPPRHPPGASTMRRPICPRSLPISCRSATSCCNWAAARCPN